MLMILPDGKRGNGREERSSTIPLVLIEQMARFAVTEAMAEFDRSRQSHVSREDTGLITSGEISDSG
jgi:hypothetical protein